jgi:hypothetical protein
MRCLLQGTEPLHCCGVTELCWAYSLFTQNILTTEMASKACGMLSLTRACRWTGTLT